MSPTEPPSLDLDGVLDPRRNTEDSHEDEQACEHDGERGGFDDFVGDPVDVIHVAVQLQYVRRQEYREAQN